MYNRRLVFTAACLGMLIFGVVLTTLGAILPSLIERFGLDKASAGSLFLLMSSGILAGSLLFGPAVDRYGYKGLLLASLLLVLLGLEGIAFAGSLGVLRLAIFAVGLGGGVINGGTNALVSDVSEEGRSAGLSLLGIFFGVGAVGVPFSLGVLLDVFSYGALVAAAGLTVLVPLALTAAIGFPTPKQAQGLPPGSAARLLGDRALILFGLLLFL
jgi:MFS family permease